VVGTTPVDEREITIESVVRAQRADTIRQIAVSFMDPDIAAKIQPETYDAVLMIARARLGDEVTADAATVSAYLTVDTLTNGTHGPHLVAEVLEEENEALFDSDHCDAIVSPMIVSYILSQVALEPGLGMVFEELTQSWGTNILFRSPEPVTGESVYRFSDLAAQAAAQGETAIGVVTSSDGARQTRLNPGADSRWRCEEIEQVIVLGAVPR
jgi:hypothetical protein